MSRRLQVAASTMALLVWFLKHPKDADTESLHAVEIERYARSGLGGGLDLVDLVVRHCGLAVDEVALLRVQDRHLDAGEVGDGERRLLRGSHLRPPRHHTAGQSPWTQADSNQR
jgi:hypothetical protein